MFLSAEFTRYWPNEKLFLDLSLSLITLVAWAIFAFFAISSILSYVSTYYYCSQEDRDLDDDEIDTEQVSSDSNSSNNKRTKATYGTQLMPSQVGKTAIVTGGAAGIGYQISLELYRAGAHVIIASRNAAQAKKSIEAMKAQVLAERNPSFWSSIVHAIARIVFPGSTQSMFELEQDELGLPQGSLIHLPLDLSSVQKTHEFCRKYRSIFGTRSLDILICNAGQLKMGGDVSQDGYNDVFHANYLGHFQMVMELVDLMATSSDARIVFFSSILYTKTLGSIFGTEEVLTKSYSSSQGFDFYGNSKFCCVAMGLYLSKMLRAKYPNIRVNINNPGNVRTSIFIANAMGGMLAGGVFENYIFPLLQPAALTAAQGAQNGIYLATSSEVVTKDMRGCYFEPRLRLRRKIDPRVLESNLQERLFTASQEYVSNKFTDTSDLSN